MNNSHQRPRRLLLDAQLGGPPPANGSESRADYSKTANFDTNMVIILAALLCALICALGINSIVRCFLRCAARVGGDGGAPPRFGRKSGLKGAALRRIPVAVYASGAAFTECPICLGEFSDGEKIRVLPKCGHCFHVKCVDVWLASHSSCPTCRGSVAEEEELAEHGGEAVFGVAGRQHGDGPASSSVEEVG